MIHWGIIFIICEQQDMIDSHAGNHLRRKLLCVKQQESQKSIQVLLKDWRIVHLLQTIALLS